MRHAGVLLFAFLATTLIPSALAGRQTNDEQPGDVNLQRLRESVIDASTPELAARAYHRLFARADRRQLSLLKNDSHLGIALSAAWREASAPRTSKVASPPQRFLGFVEGRTRLRIPLPWEVALVSRYYKGDSDNLFQALHYYAPVAPFLSKRPDGPGYLLHAERLQKTGLGFRTPLNTSIAERDMSVYFSTKHGSVHLPTDALSPILKSNPSMDICQCSILPKHPSIVAFYRSLATPFPVVAIDSNSLKWRATVWATNSRPVGMPSGAWRHDLAIVVTATCVAFFGSDVGHSDDCYLEVFDLRTGAPIVRFSTSTWNGDD
jgi:hypothetical protein